MTRSHLLPTLIAAIIGLAALLMVLFAWHLPPFASQTPFTENAYLRGKVTTLAPQLSGYLNRVEVQDFQTVKAGDLIATIDDKPYVQKLAQAQAGLDAAQAALIVAQQSVTSAKAAERAYEASVAAAEAALAVGQSKSARSHALSERGVTAQSDLDSVDLALRKTEADLLSAKAQLDMQREAINSAEAQISARAADIAKAEAAVELARIDLDNTRIIAPADGHLGQVAARIGQYVTPGTALVSHVGSDIWVIANFKETDIAGLGAGHGVSFSVDALGGRVFSGKIDGFSPATASEFSMLQGQNATGNFTKIAQRLPFRITIDAGQEAAAQLVPGMSVQVTAD